MSTAQYAGPDADWIKSTVAVREFGVRNIELYEAIKSAQFPAIKRGGLWYMQRGAVRAWFMATGESNGAT